MRALDRKLLRDLWRLRAPLGAAALVMAAGVAALVSALVMPLSAVTGSRLSAVLVGADGLVASTT